MCVSLDAREISCPEPSRPHKTECNKYFKCIKLPSNTLSWVTLTCQEGLIYDKNLRSCAIPPDDWDCNLSREQVDEDENPSTEDSASENENEEEANDFIRHEDSDEFLEVIDGEKDFELSDGKSRSDDNEYNSDDFSGDGSEESFVTPSAPTERMMTTQVQRLTQLIQNIPKINSDISADDLNTYLATQKIQSKSPDYQSIKFNSNDKTTMPADGKVHPDIETEIINRQNNLNTRLTTMSMDEATPSTSAKPIFYINKEPVTEIKLKSGDGSDGIATHQIVVNRPEGSVLFNVPAANEYANKEKSPYFSEDMLKTILEISKQMISQKTSSNQENQQHPIYYALPYPIIPPQNHVQNYYGQYPNQTTITSTTEAPFLFTEEITPVLPTKRTKLHVNHNKRINPYSPYKQTSGDLKTANIFRDPEENVNKNSYEHFQQSTGQYAAAPAAELDSSKIQPINYQAYNQYPSNNYYSPYTNNYPQNYQQFFNSVPFYQYSESDRYNTPNNFNQFSNYNGAYYGNRPFVSDSSAPSFVDHSYSVKQHPYRKESFSSYENDDFDESDDETELSEIENLDAENEDNDEDQEPKGPTDGLICTVALARQANKTDCFRYYVCNAKTKEVLSYTCPSFTAFNDQTKYCDSGMYKSCKKSQDAIIGSFKNNKIYVEAQKALQQAKRESQKVERIANLVKKQSQKIINNRNQIPDEYDSQPYYEPPKVQKRPLVVPQRKSQVFNSRPKVTKKPPVTVLKSNRRKKKKQVKCTTPGNIPDPTDSYSYWHCFKSSDGRMKRIHKKCVSNFRFCSTATYCSPNC